MKHKHSWKQIGKSQITNSLSYKSISSRRIIIPETLYEFFNINEDKNIDIIFMHIDRQLSATIECSSSNRRDLIWYQHLSDLIRTALWWGKLSNKKEYSSRSPIYLNITKTFRQKEGPAENGEYVDCDVYEVSISENIEKNVSKKIEKKDKENSISTMPFGHIEGTSVGKVFSSREALGLSGIHKPPQAGIWGRQNEGSASIVLSGGYADDIDDGDYILYTGQGGRDAVSGKQIKDQEFTLGNKGLQLNEEYNLPVRVTRGYQLENGPDEGYRYDGLYYVTGYERVEGKEGFLVCRFHLQKQKESLPSEDIEHPTSPSERVEYSGNRLKRNVKYAEQIKEIYNNTCQVCEEFLKTPTEGLGISEAAHIKAIGKPHEGPDTKANMICLCPNHHAQFDRFSFYIEPETLEIIGLDEFKGKSIKINSKHKVKSKYFEYQKQQYLKNN